MSGEKISDKLLFANGGRSTCGGCPGGPANSFVTHTGREQCLSHVCLAPTLETGIPLTLQLDSIDI